MLFRTLLFIPGNNKKFLEKSKFIHPDVLCFDLEDSVPFSEKSIGRDMVSQTLQSYKNIQSLNRTKDNINNNNNTNNYVYPEKLPQLFVRINSFESELYEQDLESIICDPLDGIVIPKVNSET
ncbi:MAG TPA: aldolase/citrate lyase family protein, partial [Nitrososphaeraceae archaeon]|nr:aldolase/citrate lyase family protein [Nitrososphaeraceae archaeon]